MPPVFDGWFLTIFKMRFNQLTLENVEIGDICLLGQSPNTIYPSVVSNVEQSRFTYRNDSGNMHNERLKCTDVILIKKSSSEVYFSKTLIDKLNKLKQ